MSLDNITQNIRDKVGMDSGLNATVKFVIDEGVIFVDSVSSPNSVSNEDKEAECTITMATEDFQAMMAGELDPNMAFMTGKLKVDGNMAVALSLQKVI